MSNAFRDGLGPRLDALEVAFKALNRKDPGAQETLQMLMQTLRESIPSYEYGALFDAIRSVEEASPEDMPERFRELLLVMRRQLGTKSGALAPLLLAGADRDFLTPLRAELERMGYEAAIAGSGGEVLKTLQDVHVSLIVMLMAPPMVDVPHLVETLRAKPLTASIPIIALTEKNQPPVTGLRLKIGLHEDLCLERSIAANTLATFIHLRLKKIREALPPDKRNPLARLLSRDTFLERFAEARHLLENDQESSVLALVAVDGLADLTAKYDAPSMTKIMERIGGIVANSFRATDAMGNWEQGMYVLHFPDGDLYGGTRAIEKTMLALKRHMPLRVHNQELHVTISAGLTALQSGRDFTATYEIARHYLEKAQSRGTGRIVCTESSGQRRRRRVLLMEVDPLAKVLRQLLERESWEVVVAPTPGSTGLEQTLRRNFSLILLDEDFGNGFDIMSLLRSTPRFNRTPVVMIVSSTENTRRALDLGANDYLQKPYNQTTFMNRMHQILNRSGGAAEGGSNPTLLMMDPDVHALIAAGTALARKGGFNVLLAKDATTGLSRLATEQVDAILMNLALPDMSGRDLLVKIREQVTTTQTKVILVTESHSEVPKNFLPGAFVRGVLVKPFDVPALPHTLNELLGLDTSGTPRPAGDEKRLNEEIQKILQAAPK